MAFVRAYVPFSIAERWWRDGAKDEEPEADDDDERVSYNFPDVFHTVLSRVRWRLYGVLARASGKDAHLYSGDDAGVVTTTKVGNLTRFQAKVVVGSILC